MVSGSRIGFFRQHPSEQQSLGGSQRIRVRARDVIHHYVPTRPGQLRGVPINTGSLFKNANLELYDDFELERKKLKSTMSGWIQREAKFNEEGQQLDPFTGQPLDKAEIELPGD